MGISTMYIVQLVASVTEDGGFGPRVMGVLASGKRISGPIATAGQLSVAAGAVVARRQVMQASSPATTSSSGSMWSDAAARELKLLAPQLLFPQFCSSFMLSIHSPLAAQMCGIFQHPGVLGRGTYFILCIFYWL